MRANTWIQGAALAAVAGVALGMAAPARTAGVEVGQPVSHSFRGELLNGMGAKSLADFRGKPVLVEFWGTR